MRGGRVPYSRNLALSTLSSSRTRLGGRHGRRDIDGGRVNYPIAKTADGAVKRPVNRFNLIVMTSPDGALRSEDETSVPLGRVRDGIGIRRRVTIVIQRAAERAPVELLKEY